MPGSKKIITGGHTSEELSSLLVSDSPLDECTSLDLLGPDIVHIFDSLPFYVMLLDKNHRILFANKATIEHLGYSPEEIVGKYCPEVIHGIKNGFYPGCPLEESVVYKRPAVREFFDEKTGMWIKSAIYPTGAWSADGEEIFFHMIEDISKRKLYEAELKRGAELKKALDKIAEILPRNLMENNSLKPSPPAETDADVMLTEREKQVLVLMAQGNSNKEIGRELFVSEKTIKTHVSRILKKLHQKNRVRAILCAYKQGLINFPAD